MKKNKPDNIVFDTETNKYNASVLPYASSVGAPSIKIVDNKSWKANFGLINTLEQAFK